MSVPARKHTAAPKEQSKEWGPGRKVPRKGAESSSAHKKLVGQRSGRRQGLGSKALGELCAQRKHPPSNHGLPGVRDTAGGCTSGRCSRQPGKKGSGRYRLAQPTPGSQLSPIKAYFGLASPQGKYSVQGPRVALTLSSPEVSASTVAILEGVFQTLGFESCWRREASVQVSPSFPAACTLSPTWGLPRPRPALHFCPRTSLRS